MISSAPPGLLAAKQRKVNRESHPLRPLMVLKETSRLRTSQLATFPFPPGPVRFLTSNDLISADPPKSLILCIGRVQHSPP